MPLYEYKCSACEHVFDKFSSVDSRHEPLSQECPSCKSVGTVTQVIGATGVVDPVRMGRIKAPGGFRDVLQRIHERTPGSKLDVDRNIG